MFCLPKTRLALRLVLGTRIVDTHRLPACFFVTVSYMCWAYRRRKMVVTGDQVSYE